MVAMADGAPVTALGGWRPLLLGGFPGAGRTSLLLAAASRLVPRQRTKTSVIVPNKTDLLAPAALPPSWPELPYRLDNACQSTHDWLMEEERLLSTGQAARRLGISVRTLYRREEAGRLKASCAYPRARGDSHRARSTP
jgi:hypothetical protein